MKPDRKALGLDVCTKNTLFYGGGGDETAVCTIMTYYSITLKKRCQHK